MASFCENFIVDFRFGAEFIRAAMVKFQHTVHIEMVYNCAKFHLPVICLYVANVLKYFVKLQSCFSQNCFSENS